MVQYNSAQKVYSGVPLGGIGTGKLEIFPDGTIGSVSIRNNWSKPLAYRHTKNKQSLDEYLPGFHFAVRIKYGAKTFACLLQTPSLNNYPNVSNISYIGEYPFAKLNYHIHNIPLDITLEAFSSIVPGNLKDSSQPEIIFSFIFENKYKSDIHVSLLFVTRNIIGDYPTGRYNLVKVGKSTRTIVFKQENPRSFDESYGEMTFTVNSNWGKLTHLGEWNMCSRNFIFSVKNISLPFWNEWVKTGALPNTNTGSIITSGSFELGGAINVSGTIAPQETKKVQAAMAWFFPFNTLTTTTKPNNFKTLNYSETSKNSFKNISNYRNKIAKWHNVIKTSGLPNWLADALINNLYVLTSGSAFKKGSFALFEAPVDCPYLGTLDVRFYGSLPVALFYPELERNELLQFVHLQKSDGYIPHDLGWSRFGAPNDGTTMLRWKDLCPKFVLMAYRYWNWYGDKKLLNIIYEPVKRAMLWEISCDHDNDALPENEGADQTFDLWEFYGANSYTSSIYLAALRAMSKMACAAGDLEFAKHIDNIFGKAQHSFISKLWNDSYFITAKNNDCAYTSCTAGQLMGQWYAHMLNLGYVVPQWYVRKTLQSIFKYNAKASRFGAVNSVFVTVKSYNPPQPSFRKGGSIGTPFRKDSVPSNASPFSKGELRGIIDNSNNHASAIWPGINYAISSLAIYEDMIDEGLELTEKVWNNIAFRQKNPWNQPDVIDATTGAFGFGDHYMRNMAIWAIPLAMAGHNTRVAEMLQQLQDFSGGVKMQKKKNAKKLTGGDQNE